MEILSASLEETKNIAGELLAELVKTGPRRAATVVTLEGNLGSGKTTFAQAVARALGIKERVTSPTFVIMKTYSMARVTLATSKGNPFYPWRRLVHIDCYRLDKADDLRRLGWNELAIDPENLILVEWPERVAEILPADPTGIKFEILGENRRRIIFS